MAVIKIEIACGCANTWLNTPKVMQLIKITINNFEVVIGNITSAWHFYLARVASISIESLTSS